MSDLVIIPRRAWGARHRAGFGARRLPTAEAWLHHSVTLSPDLAFRDLNKDSVDDDEAQAMRTLERIGQDRFGAGVSYNLAVMPSGRVYEGCGIDRVGAHTAKRNTVALGVVLVGDYSRREPPAPMQDALVSLLQTGHRLRWIDQPRFDGGHRDAPGASTACPGAKAHGIIPTLNHRAGAPPEPDPLPPLGEITMPILILFGRGIYGYIPGVGLLRLTDKEVVQWRSQGAREYQVNQAQIEFMIAQAGRQPLPKD